MNTFKRIVKNTGVFFVAQVITYIIAFFYTINMARYLGAEGFGILTFGLSFVLILGISADLGLSSLVVREVSRNKSLTSKYAGNFLIIKIFLSIVSVISMMVIINIQNYSSLTIQVVYILALWVVVNSFSQLFYSIFQAHEKMEYQSISSIINSIIILVGVIFGSIQGFGVLWFAFIYLLASLIVLIYCFTIYWAKFKFPELEVNTIFWKSSMLAALPLSVASIFSIIAFRVDTVLLSFLQGATAVGWYGAAYKLIESLMFIPMVYTAAIFPVVSSFHSLKKSLNLLYEKSVKYSIIISLPVAAIITIYSQEIISLLYGSSYSSSVIALQILIWTVPFLFLTYLFATILISIDKQNLILKTTGVAMIFNVVVNLILIPKYSYVAASVVTVLTEAIGSVICIYYLSRYIAPIKFRKIVVKPVLATLIMSGVLLFKTNLPLIIPLVFGIFLYIILLILFKVFTPDDYALLKRLYVKENHEKES
ncbi:flippase [Methanobacterium sp.]|uniref:flippase n=1 Tax=Methanobacterium sp. TaxID=2164 RepID=UPI002ABAD412|nr:flippase [Methanobacterium sp.]MDY9924277.1 flippase [Methanobacterium sp.]